MTRQAAYKARLKDAGLEQVSAWVHPHQKADLLLLLQKLRADPSLEVGPLRNTETGKLVSRN